MAKQSANLIIGIGANSEKFRKELGRIEKQSDASVKRMQKSAKAASAALVGLAVGAGVAFNQFSKFEEKFSDVVTLLDQGSFKTKSLADGIVDLKNGVLALRAETGESFDNLNKGLFDLISAGVDAEDAIDSLRVATNLAIAGATDTSVAVDGLTSALNAYELGAEDAQEVSEKFFTAQKFGKTTIEELSSGFGLVASNANSLGVSLDELLASVAATTTGGIKTNQAYTGMAAILANVIRPTKDAQEEAKRLGIEFNSTALRALGFKGFLDQVTQSAGFNETSLEKLFSSVEATKTVFALTGAGADDFDNILKELNNDTQTAATFQAALSSKMLTSSERIKRMRGEVDKAITAIGEGLTPALLDLGEEAIEQTKNIVAGFEAVGVIISGISTIAKESFNAALGVIEGFTSKTVRALGQLILSLQDVINLIPSVDIEFTKALDNIAARVVRLDESSMARQKRAVEFFSETEGQKTEILAEQLDVREQAVIESDERERARKTEQREFDKEAAQEQFEEDMEILDSQLQESIDRRDEAKTNEILLEKNALKEKAKAQELDLKREKATSDTLVKFKQIEVADKVALLRQFVEGGSAASKALFLIEKGAAIARSIVATNLAATQALATPPSPNYPLNAAAKRSGRINTAIIAGTAIAGFKGAKDGTIVKEGILGVDTEPYLLAKNEIVLPSKANPLSPDFDEEFGGVGGKDVKVIVGIEEDASQILTIQQREDSALGIQR